jgi:hypothetical protein
VNATYLLEKGIARSGIHEYEEDIARRWWALPLNVNLPLTNGESCQLIYAGRPGGSPGPDIRDAILSFTSYHSGTGHSAAHDQVEHITGDVEIHIRTADWFAHQHHTDVRYNNVVLHIVLVCDNSRPILRQDGTVIPSCSLNDVSPTTYNRQPVRWPCHDVRAQLHEAELVHLLTRAGMLRFEMKAQSFFEPLNDARPTGIFSAYDVCLIPALAEGLGFGRDRAFFRAAGLHLIGAITTIPDPLGRAPKPSPLDNHRLHRLGTLVERWRTTGAWETFRDTPPPLQRRGFSLLASYTDMRKEPQARGRCHYANYWRALGYPQILLPDVDRSHAVAVICPTAPLVRAAEHAPRDLAANMQAPRTGTARVRFLLQDDVHAQVPCFVGELEAHRACRPLVDFLVVRVTNICCVPKITHIANDQRSHACCMQRGDETRGLLVLDLSNLVFDLLELLLLGTDDALAAFAAFLHTPIDTAVELRLQFVAVLYFGTQEPPVEDMRVGPIVGDCHMYLAQVYSSDLFPLWLGLDTLFIGSYGLILRARPMDDHRIWQFPGPVQQKRGVATAVREAQLSVREVHSRSLVLDAEVALALMRGFHVGIACTSTLPPRLETGKKCLDAGIRGVGMQRVGAMPTHEVLGLQPYPFVPDGAPEGGKHLAVEPPALLREFIQLFAFAYMYTAYPIVPHRSVFLCSAPKAVIGFIRDARAKADIHYAAWDESTVACGRLKPLSCHVLLPASPNSDYQLHQLRNIFHGLGTARTDILICNIVLPFAAAIARKENYPALGEYARNLYSVYPDLSSNQITRTMCEQLLLRSEPKGACQQQGLHFIYAQSCREKRCHECLIGKQEV